MPDNAGIDGSQLDAGTPAPEPTAPADGQVEATPQVQDGSQEDFQTPEPPPFEMPEKFQGKTAEEIAQIYVNEQGQVGRFKQEVGDLRHEKALLEQQNQQLLQMFNQQNPGRQTPQTGQPSSLPGEAKGQQVDLNELFYESPIDAMNRTLENFWQQKQQEAAVKESQAATQRRQAVGQIAQTELSQIASENGKAIEPEILAIMDQFDKTDPEIAALEAKPNLTQQDIRQGVRSLYQKALAEKERRAMEFLQETKNVTPEQLQAFIAAQKQSAVNGAPASRAGTPGNTEDSQVNGILKDRGYGFLFS